MPDFLCSAPSSIINAYLDRTEILRLHLKCCPLTSTSQTSALHSAPQSLDPKAWSLMLPARFNWSFQSTIGINLVETTGFNLHEFTIYKS